MQWTYQTATGGRSAEQPVRQSRAKSRDEKLCEALMKAVSRSGKAGGCAINGSALRTEHASLSGGTTKRKEHEGSDNCEKRHRCSERQTLNTDLQKIKYQNVRLISLIKSMC